MGRKRFVSSDMSIDESLAKIAPRNAQAALMWPWFITGFDDWGRMDASPTKIKLAVFPSFRFPVKDVEDAIGLYSEQGLVHLYCVDGKQYMAVEPATFYKYQTYISKARKTEDKATIPAPPNPPWANTRNCNDWSKTATSEESLRETAMIAPSPSPSPSPSHSKDSSESTKKVDERVKPIIDYFFDKYKERLGHPYPVQGAKDGSLIRKIPKDYDVETICKLIDLFFDDRDPFIWQDAGPSIGVFYSRLPGLVAKLSQKGVSSTWDPDPTVKRLREKLQ